ncbi:MAG: hypothetical protein O8C61_12945 [Candidatus Methanoperedens sp.]|nr:hypothetical protein [Candidatus Methanoperedens sp.]
MKIDGMDIFGSNEDKEIIRTFKAGSHIIGMQKSRGIIMEYFNKLY